MTNKITYEKALARATEFQLKWDEVFETPLKLSTYTDDFDNHYIELADPSASNEVKLKFVSFDNNNGHWGIDTASLEMVGRIESNPELNGLWSSFHADMDKYDVFDVALFQCNVLNDVNGNKKVLARDAVQRWIDQNTGTVIGANLEGYPAVALQSNHRETLEAFIALDAFNFRVEEDDWFRCDVKLRDNYQGQLLKKHMGAAWPINYGLRMEYGGARDADNVLQVHTINIFALDATPLHSTFG